MPLTFNRVAGVIFMIFALVHAYRLFAPFPVQLGSIAVPDAASWAGLIFGAAMGVWGLRSKP